MCLFVCSHVCLLVGDRYITARHPDLVGLLAVPTPPQDVVSFRKVRGDLHPVNNLKVPGGDVGFSGGTRHRCTSSESVVSHMKGSQHTHTQARARTHTHTHTHKRLSDLRTIVKKCTHHTLVLMLTARTAIVSKEKLHQNQNIYTSKIALRKQYISAVLARSGR
jgi:hypothetical protein